MRFGKGAIGYTDELLKSLQSIISSSMEQSQSRFDSFMAQMKSSYDVVTMNRGQLVPQEETAPVEEQKEDGTDGADE